MTRITIGVPVYNGGQLLQQSLSCLAGQTYGDFQVLIGDNASTDETGDVCADFAARDSRFHHIRRAENIGSLRNFQDLRQRADSELFCWRAHDDQSALDFLERLSRLFDTDPAVRLAVAEVRTQTDDRASARITQYRPPPHRPRISRIRHELFKSHASWIYGLWHRESLATLQDRVHRDYSHAWGWDHLTLLPVILDGAVAGTNETHFIQRILRAGTTRAERRAKMPGLADMRALRADFNRVTQAILAERDWTGIERAALGIMIPSYVDKRGYPRAKLARRALRLRLGVGQERA